MDLELTTTDCGKTELLIKQEQGDSSPFVIVFPYDVAGMTFKGTISFPTPIELSLGNGLTVLDSVYNPARTYNKGERAYYLGNPYICIATTSLGNLPTNAAFWAASIAFSEVQLQLTSAQTETVPAGQYPFDLWTLGAFNTDPLTGFFQINNTITAIP